MVLAARAQKRGTLIRLPPPQGRQQGKTLVALDRSENGPEVRPVMARKADVQTAEPGDLGEGTQSRRCPPQRKFYSCRSRVT